MPMLHCGRQPPSRSSVLASLLALPTVALAPASPAQRHPPTPTTRISRTHAHAQRTPQVEGQMWYGGGCDLTPFYLVEQDAAEFHAYWKQLCDAHSPQARDAGRALAPFSSPCCPSAWSTRSRLQCTAPPCVPHA